MNKLRCHLSGITILFLLFFTPGVYAEGSKDLYPDDAQGNRVFMVSMKGEALPYNLFPTYGRTMVYAKKGELLC